MKTAMGLRVRFTEAQLHKIELVRAIKRQPRTEIIRKAVMMYVDGVIRGTGQKMKFEPMTDEITKAVCAVFEVTKEEILSKSRNRRISDARQCVAYMMRNRLGESYCEIGRRLNRDHATIIYFERTVETFLNVDKEFKRKYRNVEGVLSYLE